MSGIEIAVIILASCCLFHALATLSLLCCYGTLITRHKRITKDKASSAHEDKYIF